jgi:FkbM family methyltransferase
MTWTSDLRRAAFARLPKALQPVATFHYQRVRRQMDPEIALLCAHLRPGVRAIDVGANEGVYTHAFARTGALVEAFEPQPGCLDVLRRYAVKRPTVTAHGEALGADDAFATLHVPRRNGQLVTGHATLAARELPGAERHVVPVRRLDGYTFDQVAVIKIEVEGHELSVLSGARDTILRWRPVLLVEIEQRHLAVPMEEVLRSIAALGYEGSFMDPQAGLMPVSRFAAAVHQRPEQADGLGARYVNNFIFAPSQGASA